MRIWTTLEGPTLAEFERGRGALPRAVYARRMIRMGLGLEEPARPGGSSERSGPVKIRLSDDEWALVSALRLPGESWATLLALVVETASRPPAGWVQIPAAAPDRHSREHCLTVRLAADALHAAEDMRGEARLATWLRGVLVHYARWRQAARLPGAEDPLGAMATAEDEAEQGLAEALDRHRSARRRVRT